MGLWKHEQTKNWLEKERNVFRKIFAANISRLGASMPLSVHVWRFFGNCDICFRTRIISVSQETSKLIRDLRPDTQYRLKVLAINDNGPGENSNPIVFTTEEAGMDFFSFCPFICICFSFHKMVRVHFKKKNIQKYFSKSPFLSKAWFVLHWIWNKT